MMSVIMVSVTMVSIAAWTTIALMRSWKRRRRSMCLKDPAVESWSMMMARLMMIIVMMMEVLRTPF